MPYGTAPAGRDCQQRSLASTGCHMLEIGHGSEVDSLLWAGRALQDALETDNEEQIEAAAAALLQVAQQRQTPGEAVRRAASRAPRWNGETGIATAEPSLTTEDLTVVLSQLGCGHVLLAAGLAVGEEDAPATSAPLIRALDLYAADTRLAEAAGETAALSIAPETHEGRPAVDVFRSSLDTTISAVISGTVSVGSAATADLSILPTPTVESLLAMTADALDTLPQSGPMTYAGLRAIHQVVHALEEMVPESLRGEIRRLARRWWEEQNAVTEDSDPFVVEAVARHLLGVDDVEEAVAGMPIRMVTEQRLRAATISLEALSDWHQRVTHIMIGIVRDFAKLLGTFVGGGVSETAAWLRNAAALGLVSALGAALWIGGGYLHTRLPGERIPGVRSILDELTPEPTT